MWRPRPRLRRVLVKLAASRCAGAPLRKARPRQAACGGPCFAPPPRRSRRRCSGAARPPQVGALGPSAPPARSAALRPALPARPRLRRRPCRAALPTHSPPGVAARGPSLGVPPPPAEPGPRLRAAAAALAPAGGRNLDRRAHWRRKRRLPRASRAAGRRERRLRAGVPAVAPAGKAKASPAQGGKPPTGGGLACQCPGQRWANVAGVPPCAGLPPLLILVNGGAVMFAVACRVSPAGRVWWLVCRPGGVFGWSLSRSARSLWPSALAAASACQLAAASAPGTFWPAGASVGRLAVVRCG